MKKGLLLFLALLLSATTALAAPQEDALVAKALETAQTMTQLAGMESYMRMLAPSSDMAEEAAKIAALNAATPDSVRLITVRDSALIKLLETVELDVEEGTPAFDALRTRFSGTIVSLLNGREGASWLALTSVLATSGACAIEDAEESGITYVLLRYDGEQPDVCCSFVKHGGVAQYSASFVKLSQTNGGEDAVLRSANELLGGMLTLTEDDLSVTEYEGTDDAETPLSAALHQALRE